MDPLTILSYLIRGSSGGGGGGGSGFHPLQNRKAVGFLAILVLVQKLLSQHSWFGRHRPATNRWLADDGPPIVVFRSSLPSSTKKQTNKVSVVRVGPPLTKLSIPVHVQ